MPPKPDYGIDAPGVIRNLFLGALAAVIIGYFFPVITIGPVRFLLRPMAAGTAIGCSVGAILMLLYAKKGKFRHRDRMLNTIKWRGDEQVLDVGTGRGLLMIGAAKRLTTGKAIGIDIWSTKDLSGNAMSATEQNADIEGVRERVEIRSGDATHMDFADATFDVILSNLCIHNIPSASDRAIACREIARVLKPGGMALISDFIHTGEYAKVFAEAGLDTTHAMLFLFDTFPPLHVVKARKAAKSTVTAN